MSYIPENIQMEFRFGPLEDQSEIWNRLYACWRTHLDRWWAPVDQWYLLCNSKDVYLENKTVDEAFSRARQCLENSLGTLVQSTPSLGQPRVQLAIDVGLGATKKDVSMDVIVTWGTEDAERFHEAQGVLRAMLWDLIEVVKPVAAAQRGILNSGSTYSEPLPHIDYFEGNTLLLVERKDDFLARFDDPTVLERVRFPEQYEVDGLIVLGRGADVTNTIEIARNSLDATFELARAAKRGTVRISLPPWQPDVHELLEENEEDQQLYFVGYHPGLKIAEYSCAISEPDVHLRPKEIIELCYCGARKQLPDGRPLDHVRVVFVDSEAAHRERRLLRKEVKVYYLGTELELVEVKD